MISAIPTVRSVITCYISVATLCAQTSEANYDKLQKGLEVTKEITGMVAPVAKIASLAKPHAALAKLGEVLGQIKDGAEAASKLFNALDNAKDDAARKNLVAEHEKEQPHWMDLALEPAKTLARIEAHLAAVQIPAFDTKAAGGLTLADLTGDKANATAKATKMYAAHLAVIAKIEEQVAWFAEMANRADAASAAMRLMADGWKRAAEYGCGVHGTYCGIKFLEAEELMRQANGIESSAKAQRKKAEQVLKFEKTRVDNFVGNLRDLFGIDVLAKSTRGKAGYSVHRCGHQWPRRVAQGWFGECLAS